MFWQCMLTLFASVLQVSSTAWGDSRDAAREAQLRREQANQRRKIAEDEHQARMDALERIQQDNIPLPTYYILYPYPCPCLNYGFSSSTTAPTQCQ